MTTQRKQRIEGVVGGILVLGLAVGVWAFVQHNQQFAQDITGIAGIVGIFAVAVQAGLALLEDGDTLRNRWAGALSLALTIWAAVLVFSVAFIQVS
ncbi:hypothetical protein [Clavibacter zhangzhiyongii]|uniref:hypothetical protein n=1 Tax=Clavibacter zhangzhiyongii TaxID=2768071 RepID=UPI00195AB4ED|nr:hypothetical protein [Clavibacter zhangzhiyongii]MBM7025314.1 hypothetical protein [Clavibacter zhangzhiyongii]